LLRYGSVAGRGSYNGSVAAVTLRAGFFRIIGVPSPLCVGVEYYFLVGRGESVVRFGVVLYPYKRGGAF